MEHSKEHAASLKSSIRKTMRTRRRMLSLKDQSLATHQLHQHLRKSGLLPISNHLGLYMGNDGELDPSPLIPSLKRLGISCYLPRLSTHACRSMHFALHKSEQSLSKNRFGILEPSKASSPAMPAFLLSTVLVPLVAFDSKGNRIGMGGGFYDKLFGQAPASKRPKLIGVAYEFQKVNRLPTEAWDIPLNGVITDQQYYQF